jgi:hypothetical protein
MIRREWCLSLCVLTLVALGSPALADIPSPSEIACTNLSVGSCCNMPETTTDGGILDGGVGLCENTDCCGVGPQVDGGIGCNRGCISCDVTQNVPTCPAPSGTSGSSSSSTGTSSTGTRGSAAVTGSTTGSASSTSSKKSGGCVSALSPVAPWLLALMVPLIFRRRR